MLKTIVNGVEIAYEYRGKGMPLMLIHGYPLDHTIWNPIVPLLENEFDLILPDLRGFGESKAGPSQFLMTDMAADLSALLDQLKIEKTLVAGHSMGGYISLAFAHSYPERISGLGLVASQAIADSPEKRIARFEEAAYILAHGIQQVAEDMPNKLSAVPALQSRLKKLILKQHPEGVAGALRAIADRTDSTSILSSFNFPLTIIHGNMDKLIPIDRAREMKTAVENSALIEIEGVGHLPMMEVPEDTAEALRTLL